MKKVYRFIFAIIVIFLLIYILINIDFIEIYNIMFQLKPIYLILAFLSYFISFLFFNLRSMYSLSWIIPKPNYFFFLKNTFAGAFINIVTPGAQVGGEPFKAHFLSKKYKKSKAKLLGAIFADRAIHGLVSLGFMLFSILFLLNFIMIPKEIRIILETTLVFLIVFLFILIILNLKKIRFNLKLFFKKFGWLNPFRNDPKFKKGFWRKMGTFAKSFKRTIKDKKIISVAIFLSLLYWITNYLVSYFLFLSFGFKINFFLVVAVFSLGNLIGEFSPSPGGIGVIEGFGVFFYTILGINFSIALMVTLLTRIILYFYAILIGGISLLNLEKSFG